MRIVFARCKVFPSRNVRVALLCVWVGASACTAQSKPTASCQFAENGFAVAPGEKVQLAEVVKRTAVQMEQCGSAAGCVEAPVAQKTPIQIYRQQVVWTCGYVSGRNGAGPAWIRTEALRVDPYDEHPSPAAWVGQWSGGEDRVALALAGKPGALRLAGTAVWQGKFTSHSGDAKGVVTPTGNRLHFVQDSGCVIDLVLLGYYILAEDNQACGGLNVRFQGIWKRTGG